MHNDKSWFPAFEVRRRLHFVAMADCDKLSGHWGGILRKGRAMSSVVAEQLRPGAELVNPLQDDIAVILQWSVQDEHSRPIHSQTCSLTIADGNILTLDVPVGERKCAFRLTKGSQIRLPLTAQVTVNLGARDTHAAAALNANQIETRSKSTSEADADASKTVYGELNQELRRTRTLYETFLVVVTGALATVFSKRSDIAGTYHSSIGYGLGFLALIVIYMIWQIAERYRKTTSAVFNLERSWGLRAGHAPEYPLDGATSWWKDHAWRHTIWAIGLTLYALLAIGIVIATLRASPAKAAAPSATVTCACGTATSQTAVQDRQPDRTLAPKGNRSSQGKK